MSSRGIRSASDLLRLAFAYAVCDWPLRLVGAWLATLGLAQMSDVAILKRLKHCQPWLGRLIVQCLQQRSAWLAAPQRVRLRIVDATQVADAGHHKWYVHACFDLGAGCLAGVEVTTLQFFSEGWEIRLHDLLTDWDVATLESGHAVPCRVRSRKRPGGSVLDHTIILYGCGLADGDAHNFDNIPLLIGGRGGGVRSGRFRLANTRLADTRRSRST